MHRIYEFSSCPPPLRRAVPSKAHILFKTFQISVAVNLLFQLSFVFPFFFGVVMYANEFETKKKKLTEIKKN